MPAPLLETKLHPPRHRSGALPRPRLAQRLDRGLGCRLTLVSAPAGFGKTTLLAERAAAWAAGGARVGWLSLDGQDDDPGVLWPYVVAALQAAAPGTGADARALLGSGAPTGAVLTSLLNDLHAVAGDVVLALDDVHHLRSREVHDGLGFLLEHLPANAHLVLAGRTDPALPLARLRARGDLVEVRAADLRFTPEEAATYLAGATGSALAPADAAALAARTEGWIAGLQLAALSLEGRDDVAGFVAGFAGDDRFVVDYLLEEVLQRQPPHVRGFLLCTSVLGRLTGPLCDAVTGGPGGAAVLEALDRQNLFVVALDDRRRWYRYHHLFADVLRARLLDERPGEVAALHGRASEWFEQHGDRPEAIAHAFAAGDVERAAHLVELALPALRRDRQEATMHRWLAALPDDVLRTRPVLSVGYASALMSLGDLAGVEERLRDAERWLVPATPGADRTTPPAGAVVADVQAFGALAAGIAVYRAALARARGDDADAEARARRALESGDPGAHLERGAAAGLLALARWSAGDLAAAHASWGEAVASLERAGHVADAFGGRIALADIRIAQGRLDDARRTYEEGLRLAADHGGPVLRGTADLHVGLADVLRERGDLAGAAHHLRTSEALGPGGALPQHPHRYRVALARLRVAEGDLDAAVALLEDAERVYDANFFPEPRPVAAERARVRIAQGRWAEALARAAERGVTADDEVVYLREYEHLVLARALVARGAAEGDGRVLASATRLLDRILAAAEDGGRGGSVIEALVVHALAASAAGDGPSALAHLARAVALAEPEGYVRVFADEGAALLGPLRALAPREPHARRLLAGLRAPHRAAGAGARSGQVLVEPLSARELDVLRLLASELDGPGIARELVVSLNTVRTHTRNVYAKLAVRNRREAVRRATELGLLGARVRARGGDGSGTLPS
ncbi:LuxR C-terminal-related transcriptional regulator [Kineococcus glutinatus]|uniref:LuxR C-terminal-related transcriptional regulator n=1 Tax=Kineococcus glutinatus TaxID=1070872 RepID=A0ABP9HNW0_9ACTN